MLWHASASRSFYDILNVSQLATKADICDAYRTLRSPFSGQEQDSDSPESSNLEFAYFTLSNIRQRRVYDYYGRWGLYFLDTPYATYVDPKMDEVLLWYLFQNNAVNLGLGLFLGLMAARVDGFINLDYTVVFIPLFVIGAGLFLLYTYIIRCCILNTLVTPGYTDRFLEGVPGHPHYPTKGSFVRQHIKKIFQIILGLIFIVLVQLRLRGIPVLYTIICVPLYPFFFSSYIFYVLQILLISIKLDEIALVSSSWPSILSIVYCISGWHLIMLAWWGWKNGRQDREMMQYFPSHHRALVRTKLALWAITVFRPWFLNTLSVSLITVHLVASPTHYEIPFVWVVTPLLLRIVQDVFITGVLLPIYVTALRRYNFRHGISVTPSPPYPIIFSASSCQGSNPLAPLELPCKFP